MNEHPLPMSPTEHFRFALRDARLVALENRHETIRSTDILQGLLQQEESPVIALLARFGVDVTSLREELAMAATTATDERALLDLSPPEIPAGALALTVEAETITKGSFSETQLMDQGNSPSVEHLLVAILAASTSEAARLLVDCGLTYDGVRAAIGG